MKKAIVVRVVLVCVVLLGIGLVWSLDINRKYNKIRDELREEASFTVALMGVKERNFLSGVQSNWICKRNLTNDAHAEWIKTVGMSPSVANFIEVQTYQMPAYSWFAIERTKDSIVKGVLKSLCYLHSSDHTVYVSENRNLAFIRCKPGVVYVFRDVGDASLGVAMYVDTNATIKPTRSANMGRPIHSETNHMSSAASSSR